MSLRVFGKLTPEVRRELDSLLDEASGLRVARAQGARSATPFPNSTDLEVALIPLLAARGFKHHVRLQHPRTGDGFEYDFWRPADQVAVEIMGYRADDEVYKDILKFHVHETTSVGAVWVPRWKWISGQRTETNFRAAMKALAFADSYMRVEALVAVAYDWADGDGDSTWRLVITSD